MGYGRPWIDQRPPGLITGFNCRGGGGGRGGGRGGGGPPSGRRGLCGGWGRPAGPRPPPPGVGVWGGGGGGGVSVVDVRLEAAPAGQLLSAAAWPAGGEPEPELQQCV